MKPAFKTWVGDGLAVAFLVYGTLLLTNRDGGFLSEMRWLIPVGLLIASPMLVAEMKHLSSVARNVIGFLFLGLLINLFAAQVRELYMPATATLLLLVTSTLAAHRLMRAPWGSGAIITVVTATLLRSWWMAAFSYAGSVWSDQVARWLALSWHNQSGALMGTAGVFCVTAAIRLQHRAAASVVGVIGALGVGAVWLTGSRGALIATVLGLTVALLMVRNRQALGRALALFVLGAAVTASFTVFAAASGTATVTEREQTTVQTAQFRLDHWRAAGGMFEVNPLSGFGMGSYAVAAPQFAPPETHLTAFAHNELVEHLGEGGLLVGVPLLVALLAGSWMSLGFIVGPGRPYSTAWATGAAAVPAWVTLASHSLIDFDWAFPILVTLLGIATGVMLSVRQRPEQSRTRVRLVPGLAILVVLVVFGGSALGQFPMAFGFESNPLSARSARQAVNESLNEARPAEALSAATDGLRWNPGDTTLRTLSVIAEAELGQATPTDVIRSLTPGRSRLSAYATVTRWLYDRGDTAEAVALADELVRLTNVYAAWSPGNQAITAWEIKFLVALAEDGCAGVAAVEAELDADAFVGGRIDVSEMTAGC